METHLQIFHTSIWWRTNPADRQIMISFSQREQEECLRYWFIERISPPHGIALSKLARQLHSMKTFLRFSNRAQSKIERTFLRSDGHEMDVPACPSGTAFGRGRARRLV